MEYVIVPTGPRGSGKSLLLADMGFRFMRAKLPCFSNFEIDGSFAEGHFKAETLDTVLLHTFPDQLRGSLILVDEFQFYADSRSTSTTGNKLLNSLGIQIRKRQMTVGLSVQNIEWIDRRWRYQVDIQVRCRDLATTPWGRLKRIRRGELIFYQFYDMSGLITGTDIDQTKTPRPYKQMRLYGPGYWGKYDTEAVVGQEEMFRRYEAAKETITVGMSYPDNSNPVDVSSYQTPLVRIGDVIEDLVHQLAAAGQKEVPMQDIHSLLTQAGHNVHPSIVGKALSRIAGADVRRSHQGRIVNLENVLGSIPA